MSAESWTVLATIVIAAATVVYMAVSIFQGRMMLKGFRLNAFQTLKEMVTPEEPGVAKGLINLMFHELYREVFPKDYKKFEEAINNVEPKLSEAMGSLANAMPKVLQEFQEFQEFRNRKKSLSNLQDPLLGMCADEPELMDEITESIMQAREQHPLRQTSG